MIPNVEILIIICQICTARVGIYTYHTIRYTRYTAATAITLNIYVTYDAKHYHITRVILIVKKHTHSKITPPWDELEMRASLPRSYDGGAHTNSKWRRRGNLFAISPQTHHSAFAYYDTHPLSTKSFM